MSIQGLGQYRITMNHSESLSRAFERIVRRAFERLSQELSSNPLTDLLVYPDPENGEFSVLNDEHVCLVKDSVEAWTSLSEVNDEAELEIAAPLLKNLFAKLKKEGAFEQLNLQMPFSVLLVDDDMDSLEELLFMDDDAVSLDEDLLKQVDKELGDFFKQLMSDF